MLGSSFPVKRIVGPTPLLWLAARFLPLFTYAHSASVNSEPSILLYSLILFRGRAYTYSVDVVVIGSEYSYQEDSESEQKIIATSKKTKPYRMKKPGNA